MAKRGRSLLGGAVQRALRRQASPFTPSGSAVYTREKRTVRKRRPKPNELSREQHSPPTS